MVRRYEIPLRLIPDIGFHGGPARAELDLDTVVAHAGARGRVQPESIRLETVDGRPLAADYLPASGGAPPVLVVEMPPGLARPLRLELAVAQSPLDGGEGVEVRQGRDELTIQIGRCPFATYRFNTDRPDLPRPYFHPILGPTGVPITQEGEYPGRREGHFHHTGLFIAHQNFTDGNNWQIGPTFSRMHHRDFPNLQSGRRLGRFVERLDWLDRTGNGIVLEEQRVVYIYARPPASRYLDFEIRWRTLARPVTFNATPYQLLAIRVPDEMVPRGEGGGLILNSEGQRNQETSGQPARWIDLSGPLGGKSVGVALFNAPTNFRHPTPCLNFENETIGLAPTYHEPFTLGENRELGLRYRVYLHAGNAETGRVAQEYRSYSVAIEVQVGAPRPLP